MIQQTDSLPDTRSSIPFGKSLMGVGIFALAVLWLLTEPFPQNPLYHEFADQRLMFGVPHAMNVLSNTAFCLVGIWGSVVIVLRVEKSYGIGVIYLVFFFGVFFTGFGSAYYHWSPDDSTLVWDRLPMTAGFMAFTSVIIFERYSESLAYKLFLPLLILGVLSVIYWDWFGDLRPYLVIQFGPMLILPLIIWKFSGPGSRWLWLTMVFYVAAKLLEIYDHQVFEFTTGLVSGHTLKHLAAAMATLMMVAKVSASVARQKSGNVQGINSSRCIQGVEK